MQLSTIIHVTYYIVPQYRRQSSPRLPPGYTIFFTLNPIKFDITFKFRSTFRLCTCSFYPIQPATTTAKARRGELKRTTSSVSVVGITWRNICILTIPLLRYYPFLFNQITTTASNTSSRNEEEKKEKRTHTHTRDPAPNDTIRTYE